MCVYIRGPDKAHPVTQCLQWSEVIPVTSRLKDNHLDQSKVVLHNL